MIIKRRAWISDARAVRVSNPWLTHELTLVYFVFKQITLPGFIGSVFTLV